MTLVARPTMYALCLLAGTVLTVAAALLHPNLSGDGAAQLTMIAACDSWRAVHWAFLFGFALSLTGLVGVGERHVGTAGESATRAAATVGAFTYSVWTVIVAFMVGTGWMLARTYALSEPGLTATRAVFLYDMIHPFGLAAQRLAGFALGITTYLCGWGVLRGRLLPRPLAWLGLASGLIGMVLAAVFPEASRVDQAAFVLPVLWQGALGVTLLARGPGGAA